MKKAKFIYLLFTLILAGCTSMEPPSNVDNQLTVLPKKISIDEAIEIAYNMGEQFSPATSRATHSISQENVKIVVGKASRSEASDTLLYIVNFDDNQGFAIVAASNIEQPEIAYIPEGNYDPSQPSDVEPFENFIRLASHYVEEQGNTPRVVGPIELQPVGKDGWVDTITFIDKKPALKTLWGQDDIYGQYCPNGLSGCVPTAIAMFMTYRNKSDLGYNPTTYMQYTFPEKDIDGETIHWAELYKHISSTHFNEHISYESGICYESNRTNTHKTIGRIMRQIGYEMGTTYKSNSSGTSLFQIYPYIKKLYPYYRAQDLQSYNVGDCEQWIDRSGLCFMLGFEHIDNNALGHCWICDGYFYSHLIRHVREDLFAGSTTPGPNELIRYVRIEEKKRFIHLNWGWSGNFDGNYNGNIFSLKHDNCPEVHGTYSDILYIGTSPY